MPQAPPRRDASEDEIMKLMAEVVGKLALVATPGVQAELRKLSDEGKINTLLAKCPQCGGPMLAVLRRLPNEGDINGYCVPCKYPADVLPIPAALWSTKAFLKLSKSIEAMYRESKLEPLQFIARLEAFVTAFEKDAGPIGRPRALEESAVDAIVKRLLGDVRKRSWTVKELVAVARDLAHKGKLSPTTMGHFLDDNEEAFAGAGFTLIRPRLTLVRAPAARRRP